MCVRSLLFLLLLIPGLAQAWWSEEWPNRVVININSQTLSDLGEQTVNDSTVLLRLHTGNFADFFYFNQDVSDLRLIDADDKTPLKFHIEKFDLINQLMFVWVKLPVLSSKDQNKFIHMYYGNPDAVVAEDKGGSFDVNQIAAFHFDGANNIVLDSSAYAQKADLVNVERVPASLIGSGIKMTGKSYIHIVQSPTFQYLPGKGFAFSAWVKPQGQQQDAWLLNHKTEKGRLALGIEQSGLFARWENAQGQVSQTAATAPLTPDSWQHIGLNIDDKRIAVFVNGIEMASVNLSIPTFSAGQLSIGGDETGHGFVGELDEVAISSVSRLPQWFALNNKTQSQSANLLSLSAPEQEGGSSGSTSYFATILQSVSLDGWVVIGSLMLMAAVSWMVMVAKVLMIRRMHKDNHLFMEDFHKLSKGETASLDAANDEEEYAGSDFMNVMFGKHDHYQSSPNYHLYHQGVHELKQREGKSVGASAVSLLLSPQAISAIRSTLDARLVRESQKLNKNMVLLTIAIAGGPFLGLLGTVLGVMITFAAIAASGNVDINAIAPGVSAALMTTVAGLIVAIPALFGYNYLSVRIKDMLFDMDVFVDEFITKIAEQHS